MNNTGRRIGVIPMLRGAAECAKTPVAVMDFESIATYKQDALASSAKAVCDRCEARDECLELALALGVHGGVWGGMDGRERLRVMRERGLSTREAS